MDFIVYHRDCPDGFCAAFVAKKKYPEATLVGVTYGEPDPTFAEGMNILMVDFSYPRETIARMHEQAKSLLVLDHHKTAEKELEGLPFAVFDMTRSGAGLTWDYLLGKDSGGEPDFPRPWYVNYVEDRDLWTWKLPESKEISGYIMALPHTIEAWSVLDTISLKDAAFMGEAIRLHIDHYVEKVSAQFQMGFLDGHRAAVVNAAYPNISDVLNEVCKGAEVGLGWFERGDGLMQFSLRSVGDLDVSVIAKRFGGGGHRNASGFQMDVPAGRRLVDRVLNRPMHWDATVYLGED